MAVLIRNRIKNALPIEQLLKLEIIPHINYQTCQLSDQNCRAQRWRSALTIWNREQILSVIRHYVALHKQELTRAANLVTFAQEARIRKLNSLPIMDAVISSFEFLQLK